MPPAAANRRRQDSAGSTGETKQWASNMLHEKSPGSVWNVAVVAIVVLLAVMAVSGLVPGGDPATMASAL